MKKRLPESLLPRWKSMMSRASPSSQWGLWNVVSAGWPSVRTMTLADSSGPSGTLSAGRLGISSRSWCRRPSISRNCPSRPSSRSPRKAERATRSLRRCSACLASLVSAVLARRASSPISFDMSLRSARRDSTSWRARRQSVSRARTSSRGPRRRGGQGRGGPPLAPHGSRVG